MSIRTRTIISLLATFSAAAIAGLSLLRLTAPGIRDGYATLPPSLLDPLIGGTPSAVLGLLVGVVGVIVALAQLGRTHGRSVPRGVDIAGAVAALAALLLAPGEIIPVAGYTMALTTVVLVVVAVVLLTIRHPFAGVVAIAILGGIGVLAAIQMGGTPLPVMVLTSLVEVLPHSAATGAYLVLAGTLVLGAMGDGRARGRIGRRVLNHRVAITVTAALCAAPYTLVRATWLTPWPLFGGDAEAFQAEPAMVVTGLMLGCAMLTGGLLTLGLVRPWGERFPRWVAGLGGRPVPVGLPVIVATVVSMLFIAGGAGFVVQLATEASRVADLAPLGVFLVVFPFWLWGPALGLAAWGYAMHRAAQTSTVDAGPDAVTPVPTVTDAYALALLEERESRDA